MSRYVLSTFHPAVAGWFRRRFPGGPIEAQRRAWAVTSQHRKAPISGYEEWTIGPGGLISKSLGHYDAAEWDRKLGKAVATAP